MQLTQEQRELVCKAYEVATDIADYAGELTLAASFIVDEDLWVRVILTKGPNSDFFSKCLYNFLDGSLADLDAFRTDFLAELENRIIAAAQKRLAALTEGGEAEDNE